ncbi:MAG: M56 family metallopeptidase, partial [Terriglobales bacterium]
ALVLKASVIAALGMGAAALARKRSAAVRHLILAGALAALLLPLAALVAPALRIPVPDATRLWPIAGSSAISPLSDPAWMQALSASPDAGVLARPATAVPQGRDLGLAVLACAFWASGSIVFLLPVVAGLGQTRRWRQAGRPWPEGQVLVSNLARQAGAPRRVRACLHAGLPGPMTCGVVRPVILMPMDARQWPEADLQRAFTHELEHTRRGDWIVVCAARVACGLYWFHPLVWALRRRLELESERCCDDAVLRRGDALAYAGQLLRSAGRRLETPRRPLLAMAGRTDLAVRIRAVLDRRQMRGRAGVRAAALAAATATAVVLTVALAPLRVVADGRQSPKLRFDAAVVREWKPGQMPRRYRNDVWRVDPIRVQAQFAPFRSLLRYAFHLSGSEPLEGLPAWAGPSGGGFGSLTMFAVDARMPASTTDEQARMMMQSLLEDRFKLAWHWTTKPAKVLELVVARGGLKLQRVKPADAPAPPKGRMTCPSGASGCIFMAPQPQTMTQFAGGLSAFAGRPLVDKTGLSGTFYFPFLTLAKPDNSSAPVLS